MSGTRKQLRNITYDDLALEAAHLFACAVLRLDEPHGVVEIRVRRGVRGEHR